MPPLQFTIRYSLRLWIFINGLTLWVKMGCMAYRRNVMIRDDEVLARVDIRSGEFDLVSGNFPDGLMMFNVGLYTKDYEIGWNYLDEVLGDRSYRVARRMSMLMGYGNVLPLNWGLGIVYLGEILGISRNHVKRVLGELFSIGVILEEGGIWYFNPYLSYRGKLIRIELVDMFRLGVIGRLYSKR